MANYDEKSLKAIKTYLEGQLKTTNADFLKLLRGFFENKDWETQYSKQFDLEQRLHEFEEEVFLVFQYLSKLEIEKTSNSWSVYHSCFSEYVTQLHKEHFQNRVLEQAWLELTSGKKALEDNAIRIISKLSVQRARTLSWLIEEYDIQTDIFRQQAKEWLELEFISEEK